MGYYLVIDIEVTDPERYGRYRDAVVPVIERFGGSFLVRGGQIEPFEGPYSGHRLVILEFPTREKARAFWDSPEYGEVKKLREGAARSSAFGVEGA